MQLESLSCNHCGAPLEVPATANYIRCNHCQAQLAVRRTTEISYTEEIKEIGERTEQLSHQVARLAYQNELAAMDQAWERERQQYLRRDNRGNLREPPRLGHFAISVSGMAIVSLIGAAAGAPVFAIVGLVLIMIAIVGAVAASRKARGYEDARRRYQARRDALQVEHFLPGHSRYHAAGGVSGPHPSTSQANNLRSSELRSADPLRDNRRS